MVGHWAMDEEGLNGDIPPERYAALRRQKAEVDKEQPLPQGKGPEIAPLVCADIMARNELGKKKYGEPLKANNGRDALMDLYQELLDAAQYIRQLLEERK